MRGSNRCAECGLFFSYEDCDEYTNFGNSWDTEPPDPVVICGKCSKFHEDDLVKKGCISYTPWRPARYHRNAAKRLGLKFSHPGMAAWGEYRNPNEPLPEGWVWEEQLVRDLPEGKEEG